TLAIYLAGVPEGTRQNQGRKLGAGKWSFTAAELEGLTNTVPDDVEVDLIVTAVATESLANSDSTEELPSAETSRVIRLTVNNLSPVLDTLAATSVDENGVVHLIGTYHDDGPQDTHTLTIDWGEGAPQVVPISGGSFEVTHQYMDDEPTNSASDVFAISVIMADDDVGSVQGGTFTTVTNVAPAVTSLNSSQSSPCNTTGDNSVTISGSFSDVGVQDTHQVWVDWGDGSPLQQVSVDQAMDSFVGHHDYGAGGIFNVTVTAVDDDGGTSAPLSTTAVVEGVGMVNGVLYVIGTDGRDHVTIRINQRRQEVTVDAKLDASHWHWWHAWHDGSEHIREAYDAADINSIVVQLCGGDDKFNASAESNGWSNGWHHGHSNAVDPIPLVLWGGSGDDDLEGGDGHDFVDGGSGDDRIESGDGDDVVVDVTGANVIQSGSGNDTITTGDGNDDIDAGNGDDVIHAGGGRNKIDAGSGNDAIFSGNGNDEIDSGDGDDFIFDLGGSNKIRAGSGDDSINTGDGEDDIDSGSGHDRIEAGHGRNRIEAGSGDDILITGGGQDEIDAGDGDDLVMAGTGHDEIDAGQGNDIVAGGDGDDAIDGGSGLDLLIAGRGRDEVSGDGDDDILIGGWTDYDAHESALEALLAEWSKSYGYSARVANVTTSGGSLAGLNVRLDNTTVHDDNSYDLLEGDSDQDLFFYNFDNLGIQDQAKDVRTSGSNSETRLDID
ncbi:MAG: hypothetical protein AB7F89_05525, partial [Pirellulaceae bacterium]